MDNSVPAVIFKLTRHPFHHGILAIMRTLGRLGVPIYAFQDSGLAPASFSRYANRVLTTDLEGRPAEDVVSYLLEISRGMERRPVLIPVDDIGTMFVAEHSPTLHEGFLFPDQPSGLVHRLMVKKELYFLCREIGIPTAETIFPRTRAEVLHFLETATLPVVLKSSDPLLMNGRAKSVVIARTRQELLRHYDEMEQSHNPNLMLQEYIPGGADSVWMFNGYFNRESDCVIGATAQKLRQFPPYVGSTSLGICSTNETVERTTSVFMKSVGYRGILDIGYRYDARDGQYKVLDVNPRVGMSFRLFADVNGLDVVRAMYLDLTGQEVKPGPRSDGRKWIVENCDVASSVKYVLDRRLTLRDWFRSLRAIQESAWFAGDDPLPFVATTLMFFPYFAFQYLTSGNGTQRGRLNN